MQQLLERGDEIAALRAACDAARAGAGRTLAITGPAGAGKTALLTAARELALQAGFEVLSASGTELERDLAFGLVRQLFDRTGELEGAAALATPVLVEVPTSGEEALAATTHGLYWLAAERASRNPLLLVVDDAQWGDSASLRWLAYLARRLDGVPLLLLIAARDAEPGTDAGLVDRVLDEARATPLRPGPLSRAAVERWLHARFDQPPAPQFTDRCWTVTGGNPFLLHEVTAELAAQGLAPDTQGADAIEDVAPATIAQAVLKRLRYSGPAALAVAEAVAVLSADARIDLIADLAELSVPVAAGVVDTLIAADILRSEVPVAFAHPVLRSAVYEQLAPLRRGLAHARAANRLRAGGAGPERVAQHLLPSPATGDAAVAETLRETAAIALARGAPDTAVTLLRRALDEPPRDRKTVLLELARVEALSSAPEAVDHAREAGGADGALVAADALFRLGRVSEAVDELSAAERVLDERDPDAREALRAARLLMMSYDDATHLDAALTALGVDAMPGLTVSQRQLLALRAMDVTSRCEPHERGLELSRRVLRGANGDSELIVGFAARAIGLAGALDEARTTLDALIERGRRGGLVTIVASACFLRSEIELHSGRLAEAEADARESLALSREHGLWSLHGAVGHLTHILAERERPEGILAQVPELDTPGRAPTAGYAFHGRALVRAASGDLEGAIEDLRRCGTLQAAWGDFNPGSIPWRSSLALLLHARGDTEAARALAEEDLALARRYGASRPIGVALRARALLDHGEAAVRGLQDAVAVLAAGPARLEHARALVDLGAALRRSGRRAEARDVLRNALDAAHRCGAHRLTARAHEELRTAGARPRRERLSGPEALTAAERRVAQMAAQGLTNRQIAQALFVTTKTVEMHLARVYVKLAIKRRLELAAALSA